MCLGDDHFEWTLRGDLLVTWTWRPKSHQMCNLSSVISWSTIPVSSFWDSNNVQVVTVNVIPKFAQVLSHLFILFASLSSGWLISIFLSCASKIFLLLLMLSVAFFILLHFIHCNLKQQNFCLVPSLFVPHCTVWGISFFASLHSCLTRIEYKHSSESIES